MDDNKQSQKQLQDSIRKNLENILENDMPPVNDLQSKDAGKPAISSDEDGLGAKLDHPYAQPTDFHKVKDEALAESRKTLKALIDFYKVGKSNEYAVKYKRRVDEMSLSNIMFAMKAMQQSIIKLMEDIDMGNTHPRNFEALATLNGQLMNLIKHQAAYMVTMEEGYKKIKNDQAQMDAESGAEDTKAEDVTGFDPNNTFKSRGTKLLMQNLKKTTDAKTEEAHEDGKVEEAQPRLTDARNRPDSAMKPVDGENNGEEKNKPEGGIYGDLDEHF